MNIPEEFGMNVFNDAEMKKRLDESVYRALKRTMEEGKSLDLSIANSVANAMKDWAIENNATHFTHWFQPMTGITAEKHESFISPGPDGSVMMDFSGKELIRGESDASSFPSGGLRATFEARGYTAWDPTSYAFLKGNTLCIPTAFCSYSGDALDKKTPLLRSMEAINRQALRVLKLFGNEEIHMVRPMVGAEQEYFLISKEAYEKRPDLIYTGRTLFGAKPPKGQELDDHYYGTIKPEVQDFMQELDEELWRLGIMAKTEHNEAAPSQYELASVYMTANIATDHNQLIMETMQRIAKKHNLVCLLHEKPFLGVAGSGKHNNWSLETNTGVNLFKPGDTPYENAQFLLLIAAVIEAVDNYGDLLRLSAASAGNDLRLGEKEAPPVIVSLFLGEELTKILECIEEDREYVEDENVRNPLKLGVHVLPKLPKDTADRNRTAPFAFTGNKFEFRMLGSAESTACTNIMLNTAVAESLRIFADRLEKIPSENFNSEIHNLIKEVMKNHKKVIFNGNAYDGEWTKEATEKRGLCFLNKTADAVPMLMAEKNLWLFERHGIYTKTEATSRAEIILEHYSKVLHIEALTMIDLTKRKILPAIYAYEKELADTCRLKTSLEVLNDMPEKETLNRLSLLAFDIFKESEFLSRKLEEMAKTSQGVVEKAKRYEEEVLMSMKKLRKSVDEAETITDEKYWPFPSIGKLLFSIG